MAQRQFIVKHDSESVQGRDSFVKTREILYGDLKRLMKEITRLERLSKAATDDKDYDEAERFADEINDLQAKLVTDNVTEWNWVDSEGKPLPLPKDDPDTLDMLTKSEVMFLQKRIMGTDATDKKK